MGLVRRPAALAARKLRAKWDTVSVLLISERIFCDILVFSCSFNSFQNKV